VVSGIVMAFQFGTNWSVLSKMSGPVQGPLLMYETFTAFMLEASFFGVLIFGRSRVPPWFYLFSTAMVALGTTFSAFWIMVNNSWMQVPTGYVVENGMFVPNDWTSIIQNAAHEDANIIFGAVLDENMGDEVKITVIATGFRQEEMPLRRERMLAEPALPTYRQDVPIQRYSIPKPPAARFASETANELDVKPAGSPTPAPAAPPEEPAAAPEEKQQAAPVIMDTLIPVRASVFDDDFFRSARDQEMQRAESPRSFAVTPPSPERAPEPPRMDEHDFLLSVDVKQVAPRSASSWESGVAEPVVRNPPFATAHSVETEQRESDELDIPAFLRRNH